MGTHAHNDNTVSDALRRIDKLEAERRRVLRSLSRCTPGSDLAAELAGQRDSLDRRIGHLRDVVARAEAAGYRAWSREDFRRGDYVRYRDLWFPVLRVNRKSVTVPQAADADEDVVRAGGPGRPEWTWKIGYHDGITGRMSAEEMAERTGSR